jgi:signal transduction histidine kinase
MAQPGYRPVARPGRRGPLAARLLPARGAHAATGQPTVTVLVLLSVGSGLALVGVLAPTAVRSLHVVSAVLVGVGGFVAWWSVAPDPAQPPWVPKSLAVLFLTAVLILAADIGTHSTLAGGTDGPIRVQSELALVIRGVLMAVAAGIGLWSVPAGVRGRPADEWTADTLLLVLGLTVPLLAVILPQRSALAPLSVAEWILVAGIVALCVAAGTVALWPRPPFADPGQAIVVSLGAFGGLTLEVIGLAGGWGLLRDAAHLNAGSIMCAALLAAGGILRTRHPRFESIGLAVTVAFGVLAAVSPWLAPRPNRLWGFVAVIGAATVLAFRLIRTDARSDRDRTALAAAVTREQEAAQRLRALDELKTTFLRAVSHDLRTPLTVILGSALTLQRRVEHLSPQDRAELLGRLGANARKLERLLTDLLDLDRLSRGILEPRRRPTDVGALVRKVEAEMEALADRPVTVVAPRAVADVDAPKVERIVENLLINAARHTPAGTPVWIRVDPQAAGVQIAVEDAGPGLPADRRESIFEAFQQGPDAAAHAPGVGIGLSLVIRFAELHGGHAWVQDRPGGGASFRVLLPDRPPLDRDDIRPRG